MENDNAAYRNDLIRRKDLFIFTNATEEQIAHIPAVDAVEVVRCRECRLHGICSTEDVFRFAALSEENRYCGVGQRRKDGEA